jgi:hypothetical protein
MIRKMDYSPVFWAGLEAYAPTLGLMIFLAFAPTVHGTGRVLARVDWRFDISAYANRERIIYSMCIYIYTPVYIINTS